MRRHLLLMTLILVVALILAGCAREASVSLAGGAEGESASAERHAGGTDDRDEEGDAEATDDEAGADGQDSAAPAEDPDTPVSSDGATTAPAAPRKPPAGQAASSPGSSGSGASGGGSQPHQGIAVGEPHPDDPDGCAECQSPDPSVTPEPRPQNPQTEPRPGTDNPRAREWESAEVHADDVTVTVTWWSGVEPCHVLDRVEVDEQADKVVITLYEGSQAGYDGACTAQAVQKRTQVKLSSPLKGRTIVDGAKK